MHSFTVLNVLLGLSWLSAPTLASPLPSISLRDASQPRTLKAPIVRSLAKKSAVKRDPFAASLSNDVYSYDILLDIGSPAQTVKLQLDTGSSDLWVLAPGTCDTSTCTCPSDGCTYFDPTQSTSAVLLDNQDVAFDFSYGSGDASGDYYVDAVNLSGASLSNVIIGVATDSITEDRGIMGVGLPTGESPDIAEHAGVIELLAQQGYISSNSYSLYLDDYASSTGAIIFGGVDDSAYSGSLVPLPIVPSPDGMARLTVSWTAFAINIDGSCPYASSQSSTSSLASGPATLLDSGTTLADVPSDIFSALQSAFSLTQDPTSGAWLGACSIAAAASTSLTFGFGGTPTSPAAVITVPASEIMRPNAADATGQTCLFGFQPGGDDLAILGDVFLTSAYAYYDFDAYTISLAQASWT